jgi:phosphatidylglycerol---prolipoprotein diacylglyceryl transferase
MLPTLFTAFGYPVKTYGFSLALAHIVGLAALFLLARKRGLSLESLVDLFFVAVVTGLIGARALYVLTHWPEFQSDPWSVLSLNQGGLSLFGGFVPAFLAVVGLLRWKKLRVFRYADALCPALPFSIALIRLGCFAQGCCYGAPLSAPWAVSFTRLDSKVPPALLDHPLHPTQLYEAAFLLLLTLALLVAQKRARLPEGFLGIFTVLAYCVFRFFTDFHRGDIERGYLGVDWLTLTQIGSLLGILSAPVVALLAKKARS